MPLKLGELHVKLPTLWTRHGTCIRARLLRMAFLFREGFPMRLLLLLLLSLCSACKTAEFAVDHQMSGVHIVAKFESKDSIAVVRRQSVQADSLRY